MALAAKFRVFYRLGGFILLTLLYFLPIWLIHQCSLTTLKMRILRSYYWMIARLWGMRIEQHGAFSASRPMMVVSNHCSYLDVPVMGALAPLHFTPKADVARWPVIGYLCKLASCIFIDRSRQATLRNEERLRKALQAGKLVSLFPEGTTNDGTKVRPFRSSYFKLAAEQLMAIQPVKVEYIARNGDALAPEILRKIVWIDDDEFAPHLVDFLALSTAITARITCYPPLSSVAGEDRKLLAERCYQIIAEKKGISVEMPLKMEGNRVNALKKNH